MTQRLFTNAQFAQRAALIATKAAKWARDLLDDAAAPASPTRVEEFGSEIADVLDRLGEEIHRSPKDNE